MSRAPAPSAWWLLPAGLALVATLIGWGLRRAGPAGPEPAAEVEPPVPVPAAPAADPPGPAPVERPEPTATSVATPGVDAPAPAHPAGVLDETEALRNWIRGARRQGIARRIDTEYGEFIDTAGLDPPGRRQLRDLLVRKWSSDDTGDGLSGPGIDDALRTLLGPDGFDRLARYEARSAARRGVGGFRNELGDRVTPLTPEQDARLVELFFTHGAAGGGAGIGDAGLVQAVLDHDHPEARVDATLNALQAAYQAVLDEAVEFLDEDQMASLETHFNRRLQQRETQAEAAIQLGPHLRELRDALPGEPADPTR